MKFSYINFYREFYKNLRKARKARSPPCTSAIKASLSLFTGYDGEQLLVAHGIILRH